MRLVCPHCDTAYDVPPALLAGRRAVRCARCTGEWMESGGVAVAVEDAPVTEAEPTPLVAETAPPRRAIRSPGARFGWAGSVLLLALGAWSAVAWRTDVMHAWPPSGRVYSALGLTGR